MNLYDRTRSYEQVGSFATETAMVNFVKTTYKFFAASLFFATIGAVVGWLNFATVMNNRFLLFIIEIAALFGLMFSRDKPGLNVIMLFIFTTLTGVTIVPLLGFVVSKSGLSAVWQALAMTTIVFASMSIFAIKTKSDLANIGKMLMISLIIVLVCSVVNLFLKSPIFHVLISGVATILFSIFVAFDTQNMLKGLYKSPVDAAISLYLSFLNIFISILQLIGIFGGRDE